MFIMIYIYMNTYGESMYTTEPKPISGEHTWKPPVLRSLCQSFTFFLKSFLGYSEDLTNNISKRNVFCIDNLISPKSQFVRSDSGGEYEATGFVATYKQRH